MYQKACLLSSINLFWNEKEKNESLLIIIIEDYYNWCLLVDKIGNYQYFFFVVFGTIICCAHYMDRLPFIIEMSDFGDRCVAKVFLFSICTFVLLNQNSDLWRHCLNKVSAVIYFSLFIIFRVTLYKDVIMIHLRTEFYNVQDVILIVIGFIFSYSLWSIVVWPVTWTCVRVIPICGTKLL